IEAADTVVAGCFIGALPTSAAAGNRNGILVTTTDLSARADRVRIGGTAAADRNVLGSHVDTDLTALDAADLVVQGNLFGLDKSGVAARPSALPIVLNSAPRALVGGPAPAGNFIAASLQGGLISFGVSPDIVVQGNTVGLNVAGAARGNAGAG